MWDTWSVLNFIFGTVQAHVPPITRINALTTIKRCRSDIAAHGDELEAIHTELVKLLLQVSDNLPEELAYFRFTPMLCGSTAVGTKCFQPTHFEKSVGPPSPHGSYAYGRSVFHCGKTPNNRESLRHTSALCPAQHATAGRNHTTIHTAYFLTRELNCTLHFIVARRRTTS